MEGRRASVDFETLSIPGVPLAPSPLKGEAMLDALIKIQSDFTVGDKRLSSARYSDFSEIKPAPLQPGILEEILSIDNEKLASLSTKRAKLI